MVEKVQKVEKEKRKRAANWERIEKASESVEKEKVKKKRRNEKEITFGKLILTCCSR